MSSTIQNYVSSDVTQMTPVGLCLAAHEISSDPSYMQKHENHYPSAHRIFFECIRRGFHAAAWRMLEAHPLHFIDCHVKAAEYEVGVNAAEATSRCAAAPAIRLSCVHVLHMLALASINVADRANLAAYKEMTKVAVGGLPFERPQRDIMRYAREANVIAQRCGNNIFRHELKLAGQKAKKWHAAPHTVLKPEPGTTFPARPVTNINEYRQSRLLPGARS